MKKFRARHELVFVDERLAADEEVAFNAGRAASRPGFMISGPQCFALLNADL